MTKAPEENPPIGGADLECLMVCRALPVDRLLAIISICEAHGFQLGEVGSLLAYGDSSVEPQDIAHPSDLARFVADADRSRAVRCIANLWGVLVDTRTTLSVLLDLARNVAVVSVPEDVLWGFGSDPGRADFDKLRVFAACCREISAELSPEYAHLGTEELHPEDLSGGAPEAYGASRVDEEFFSDQRLRELFDWYVNVYTKRWNKN